MTLAYTNTRAKAAGAVARPFLPTAFRERGAWHQQNDASSAADSQQASAAPARARAT